jgi:hypothetical protein
MQILLIAGTGCAYYFYDLEVKNAEKLTETLSGERLKI